MAIVPFSVEEGRTTSTNIRIPPPFIFTDVLVDTSHSKWKVRGNWQKHLADWWVG